MPDSLANIVSDEGKIAERDVDPEVREALEALGYLGD